MKAKKYRLETVLAIRSRARDEAAQQVSLRLQELQTAEDELARRRKKLQTCSEQLDKANRQMNAELEKGVQAREILAHQSFLNDLKKQEADWQRAVEETTGGTAVFLAGGVGSHSPNPGKKSFEGAARIVILRSKMTT